MSLKLRNKISSKILDIIKCSTPKILPLLELNKNKHELEIHLPVSAIKENLDSRKIELFEKYQDEDIKKVQFDSTSKHAKFVFYLNKTEVIRETFKDPLEVAFNSKSSNIVVEFSSPNIAKPFHVGHLRSTIIGNFISNLFRETNNKVTRLNWLGDWGTQFGFIKVGVDLENFTDEDLQKDPIKCLFKAYVTANLLAEKDPMISRKAREVFQQLESDNFQDIKKWEMYREYTVNELRQIYKRLNVEFDQYDWESMYGKRQIEEIINLMNDKNILIRQDDGKQVVEIGDRRIPIIKSDGTTLYLTRDLAAIIDRKKRFEFDEMFYVVDNGQNDHFQALTGLLQQLNFQWSSNIYHIKFGRIKGMSTRKGTVVFLQDILDEAKEIMWKRQKESSKIPLVQPRFLYDGFHHYLVTSYIIIVFSKEV